jgi:pSer/pThr/pTyr-binding forkhead associated (FHA) protein
LFTEKKNGDSIAVLEDLSGNGTFVNDTIVGRNKRRELKEGDEIAILDQARFVFRYPLVRNTHKFRQQYKLQEQLGKGHFASVYLCVEKSSGVRYAVKKFEKRTGPGEKSKVDGLQQEIAVLMGVSHPTLLCLKDTFNEDDGVYLVLELATEGELFNWIVMKQKLTESEARKVFVQLFQAVKYLVCFFEHVQNATLIITSTSATLCIVISSPRTSSLPTRTYMSSWQTLVLQRLLERSRSQLPYAVHHHVRWSFEKRIRLLTPLRRCTRDS